MRAIQIVELNGPDWLAARSTSMSRDGDGVVVDVRAAGVPSQVPADRGLVPDQAGCRSCPAARWPASCAPMPTVQGRRPVAAFSMLGRLRREWSSPARFTFLLAGRARLRARAPAGRSTHHTAYFSLGADRGRCRPARPCSCHGAAGGVGTASMRSPGAWARAGARGGVERREGGRRARTAGAGRGAALGRCVEERGQSTRRSACRDSIPSAATASPTACVLVLDGRSSSWLPPRRRSPR